MWKAEVCDLESCWVVGFDGTYDDFMDYIDEQGWDVADVWELD